MVDPKEKFEEGKSTHFVLLGTHELLGFANINITECKESKGCAPVKHHYDECVERVTGADEGKPVDKKHPNEDCVEECMCHFAT